MGMFMNKAHVRRILLVVASILNWIFSVGYVIEMQKVLLGKPFIKYADNINIDGSDFTPLANLAITGANGLAIFFTMVFDVLAATIFVLLFAILLRVTTIRKNDIIMESELAFAKCFIIVSSILAFIVGILSASTKLTCYAIGLSWQQPLFMLLIYYRSLKKQFQKGMEMTHLESE